MSRADTFYRSQRTSLLFAFPVHIPMRLCLPVLFVFWLALPAALAADPGPMLVREPAAVALLEQGRAQMIAFQLDAAEASFERLEAQPSGRPAALLHLSKVALWRAMILEQDGALRPVLRAERRSARSPRRDAGVAVAYALPGRDGAAPRRHSREENGVRPRRVVAAAGLQALREKRHGAPWFLRVVVGDGAVSHGGRARAEELPLDAEADGVQRHGAGGAGRDGGLGRAEHVLPRRGLDDLRPHRPPRQRLEAGRDGVRGSDAAAAPDESARELHPRLRAPHTARRRRGGGGAAPRRRADAGARHVHDAVRRLLPRGRPLPAERVRRGGPVLPALCEHVSRQGAARAGLPPHRARLGHDGEPGRGAPGLRARPHAGGLRQRRRRASRGEGTHRRSADGAGAGAPARPKRVRWGALP